MIGLIRAQWLILRHRPLLWALAAIHIALLAVQFLLPLLLLTTSTQLSQGAGGAPALPPEALAQLRLQSVFPGAFATIFGHINGIGGLLLMVFCGAFIGADYNWGTIRAVLVPRPSRTRYLLGKLAALTLLAALMVLLTLAFGAIMATVDTLALGEPLQLSAAQAADV